MRKSCLWLLLSLLLLIAQQGGVTHEISHYSDGYAASKQRGKQSPDNKLCEKCLMFAQLSSGINPEPPSLSSLLLLYDAPPQSAIVFLTADAPANRSRDPPVFL